MPILCKPTNPKFIPLPYLTLTHHIKIFLLYITPGPDTRQLEATRTAQSFLGLFKTANPKLLTLLCLIFPVGTSVKAAA